MGIFDELDSLIIPKKVLVACELSGIVCNAFRVFGHEAYSCDLQGHDITHPCLQYHIVGDALKLLDIERYDLVIAHPPCTHLCVSGARWFKRKQESGEQDEGIDLFLSFVSMLEDLEYNYNIQWAIENPVGIMSRLYRKPDQIIQPYEFGHPEKKKTCLWLSKNLPLLEPTDIVTPMHEYILYDGVNQSWGSEECRRERSMTYKGIANAMAEQWGGS